MSWTSDLRSQETLPAIVNRMAKADPRQELLADSRGRIGNLGRAPRGDDPLGGPLSCSRREEG